MLEPCAGVIVREDACRVVTCPGTGHRAGLTRAHPMAVSSAVEHKHPVVLAHVVGASARLADAGIPVTPAGIVSIVVRDHGFGAGQRVHLALVEAGVMQP